MIFSHLDEDQQVVDRLVDRRVTPERVLAQVERDIRLVTHHQLLPTRRGAPQHRILALVERGPEVAEGDVVSARGGRGRRGGEGNRCQPRQSGPQLLIAGRTQTPAPHRGDAIGPQRRGRASDGPAAGNQLEGDGLPPDRFATRVDHSYRGRSGHEVAEEPGPIGARNGIEILGPPGPPPGH